MLCLKDQKFFITIQDKETKIQEWNMEFIVDVQSLAQHGEGKWKKPTEMTSARD